MIGKDFIDNSNIENKEESHHDHCHDGCHEHHHEDCHDDCCSEHHHEHCHDDCCSEHHHDHCNDEHCHDEHCHCHAGCSCCAAKGKIDLVNDAKSKVNKKKLAIKISTILFAVILMVIGFVIEKFNKDNLMAYTVSSTILYVIAYLVAGYECLIKAVKNILKGEIFDENFLMTVASIGAMAIGEMTEGIIVMVLYGIGEMLEDFALRKSKKSIASLMSLKQEVSHIIVDEEMKDISTDRLTIGDIILVKSGEKVPVDGVLIEGDAHIDNSAITGESMPIDGALGDVLVAGGINIGDAIRLRVVKEYKDTTIKKIIDIVSTSSERKPKSAKAISKFAKYYTPIVCLIALIVSIVPSLITKDWTGYIHKALVFLVISCPCAIVISVPLAVFSGIGGASKKGILIKGGNILENINSVDVIAFDKTGTLTTGKFEVTDVIVKDYDKDRLLDIVSSIERHSSHPIAKNIVSYHESSIHSHELSDLHEIKGKGMVATYGGNVYRVGNLALMNEHCVEGIDIISDDKTIIYVCENERFIGAIMLEDTIKEGAKDFISYLKKRKIDVVMLTGDRESVAKRVASDLGIDEFHAGLLPEDKNAIVDSYVKAGKKIMFMGDGINDAPSLASANIGVCNNAGNNDISMEAGDVILMNGSSKEMNSMFKVAKKTNSIVIENIVFSLLIKLIIAVIDMTIFPSMLLAIVADVGVTIIAILNSIRALK